MIPAGAVPRPPAAGLPTSTKYALLDLEFELTTPIDLPRLSLRDLRQLGLLAPAPAEDELGVGDQRAPMERVRDLVTGRRAADFLPRTFRVRDACITNMPTLWLGKHFHS